MRVDVIAVAFLFLCCCASPWLATAQSAPEATAIIRSLAPRSGQIHAPSGRPLDGPAQPPPTESVIIRNKTLKIDLSRQIDLEVLFEYGSAKLTPSARRILDRLGLALRSPELQPFSFLIAGHTDAVGSDEYNLDLSERRAGAAAAYLIREHGLEARRLVVVGYGFRKLKIVDDPGSAANRRVQVALVVD